MMSCQEDVVVGKGGVCDGKMVRWERPMPRMSMRVLLVEADESTRQVIAALLRKCSYKVAAVSDGLTAWEVLKEKPNSIDLILMEMGLPSISGFALLTLIMEHDICKNIPVIMMSKNDSVNVVYKCMLRGASDFLVKPLRKNELQNLWQHVWRRQATASSGKGAQDESITQPIVDRLLGNDILIKESNDVGTPENEECSEKGNNAQDDCETSAEGSYNNDSLINGSREAVDMIGIFQNHSNKSFVKSTVTNGIYGKDSSPWLDLSLRRYDDSQRHRDITVNERTNGVHQSDSSAFSRYKPSPRSCEGSFDKQMSALVPRSNFRLNGSHSQDNNNLIQGAHPPQLRMPVTVQASDVSPDQTCANYGSSIHPSHYEHKGASPTTSPDSGRREVSSQVKHIPGHSISSCGNQMAQKQDMNSASIRHIKNVSSVTEGSQNSSYHNNGFVTCLNSFGSVSFSGSNCSSNPTQGITTQDENTMRSLQREAALNKFRLKRKDRCFEKKVRYESRKKLAENRPRVKGQFVRQAPTDPSSITTADS